MNFEAILETLPTYGAGVLVTLKLLVLSLLAGGLVALPLAVLRVLPQRWLHGPVWLFTYVIRGTPMLVQLFIIYYGLAQFEWVRESFAWPWLQSATFCAWLAFSINTCAYTTEIIAGALRTTPLGEIEAARAMGMSRALMLRRILLPAALRRAMPAYGNEAVMMLQGTSLASVVTLLDITGVARDVNARFYLPFEAFITAGVLYLVITLTMVGLLHAAEKRLLVHLRPRA
jgi:arginine/ornithine transport system permease protein